MSFPCLSSTTTVIAPIGISSVSGTKLEEATQTFVAQARSFYLGDRAFRFRKVGGGTIEAFETALPNNELPWGFEELLPATGP